MSPAPAPRLLLLGAGHANLLAARTLRLRLPQACITIIDAAPSATYSGMIPGHVARMYPLEALRIDLTKFAAHRDLHFVQGRIESVDAGARRVVLQGGRCLEYDLAALDVGSHTAMPEMPGYMAHAVSIKPLDNFAARLSELQSDTNAVIIGGGVAGAEVALALACRLGGRVTLIEAGPVVAASLVPTGRACLISALESARVRVLTQAVIAGVESDCVVLADGSRVPSSLTVGIAGSRAHPWLARDLPADDGGFVRVTPTLQVEGHPTLFATGDCAAMNHAPRPKAGVFAVRQAPVLTHNLVAVCLGNSLTPYMPQQDYLKIVSLGGKKALAEWHGITLCGKWPWHLKDWIDRRFIRNLQD